MRINIDDLPQNLDQNELSAVHGGMSNEAWRFWCTLGFLLGKNDGSTCDENPYDKHHHNGSGGGSSGSGSSDTDDGGLREYDERR